MWRSWPEKFTGGSTCHKFQAAYCRLKIQSTMMSILPIEGCFSFAPISIVELSARGRPDKPEDSPISLRERAQKVKDQQRDIHVVDIVGIKRNLPLFEVAPGVRIAVLNILGDTELVSACAAALGQKLGGIEHDVIVTAETKSVPLAYALALELDKPWVVLRKNYKPYMGEALKTETHSITTGHEQTLYLDEKDHPLIRDRRVALVDDVISTGSTLQGMHKLVTEAGGRVVAQAAIFTEGDKAKWTDIIALGHLPVFVDGES